MIELSSGLKGVTHRNPIRNLAVEEIERIADNRIYQVKNVDWNQKGKIDFVMVARINAVHRRAGK